MKYLLSILMCFGLIFCEGQILRVDTTQPTQSIISTWGFQTSPYKFNRLITQDDGSDTTYISYPLLYSQKSDSVVYDTVKTMMVICDTSRVKYGEHFITDSIQTDATGFRGYWEPLYTEPNHDIYWQIGYEIRSIECCANGYNGNYSIYKPISYYSHIKYLDADKKELSKNIVVWMSMSTKTVN